MSSFFKLRRLFFICLILHCISANTFGQEIFGTEEIWYTGSHLGSIGNYFADVNGDGIADAIKSTKYGIEVAISNGSQFEPATAWTTEQFAGTKGDFGFRSRTYFKDVTGDGMADAIAITDDKILVRRSNGVSFQPIEIWCNVPFNSISPNGIDPNWYYNILFNFIADVDGDGRADAIVTLGDSIVVRLSNGVIFATAHKWSDVSYPDSDGDMNGDGYVDMITHATQFVNVTYSAGNRFYPTSRWVSAGHEGIIADVTGDGRADEVYNWSTRLAIRISQGTGYLPVAVASIEPWGYGTGQLYISDVTGDGKADAILVRNNQILVRRSTFLNDCSNDVAANNIAIFKTGLIYRNITSEGAVNLQPTGAHYKLRATKRIVLSPNFRATAGTKFSAKIESCNSENMRMASQQSTYESLWKLSEENLNEELENKMHASVFPNPASNSFNFDYMMTADGKISISLLDQIGKVVDVIVDDFQGAGNHVVQYDCRDLSNGIYILRCEFNGRKTNYKVSIVRGN